MVLVLVLGGGLGWFAHRARVQRDAVAAIVAARGRVAYGWELSNGPFRTNAKSKPPWPAWLIRLVGLDALGTVRSASLGPQDYATVIPHVARLERLVELNATRAPVPNAELAQVMQLRELERLWIRLGDKTGGSALEGLHRLTRLKELALLGATDDDLAHLNTPAGLRKLSIGGASLSDAGVIHLKTVVGLRELVLQGVPVTSAGLAGLRGMYQLDRLFLVRTRVDDLSPIGHLQGVALLEITDSPLGDSGLAGVSGLTNLRLLNLAGTNVSDAGLIHLAPLTNLGSLDVSGTRVTDAGLVHLRALPNLHELSANGTEVSDAGIANLKAELPMLKHATSGKIAQRLRPR